MAKNKITQDSSDLEKSLFSDYDALLNLSLKELKKIAKNLKIKNVAKLDKTDLAKSITETIALIKAPKKERKTKKTAKLAQELKTVSKEEKNFFSDYDSLISLAKKELSLIAKELKIENIGKLAKADLVKVIIETKSFAPKAKKTGETKQTIKKNTLLSLPTTKNEQIDTIKSEASKSNKKIILDSEIKNQEKIIKKKKNKFIESFKPENISDLSQAIDLIGKNLKQGFIDEREAAVLEKEITDKFLLKPSKYSFGNVNKEFLLEDEENIQLPETYEEDKLVLLPVDPVKLYLYWDLSPETMKIISAFKPSELLLKVNDVTGIIYNGGNANHFWFESCPVDQRNFYINLDQGNRNICIELGFSRNGLFRSLVTSNTVYIPRRNPSSFLKDTFVIVDFQKEEEKIPSFGEQTSLPENNDLAKIPPSFRKIVDKSEKPYVFFKKEFSVPVKKEEPISLIDFSEIKKQKEPQKENIVSPNQVLVREEKKPIFQEQKKQIISFPQSPLPDYFVEEYPEPQPVIIPRQETTTVKLEKSVNKQEIIIPAEPDREIFFPEIVREKPLEKIIIESEEESETRWFWVSETIPVPHEQLFKISWGPIWFKEFVGGSEVYRYQGSSERFIGASERFIGGSEKFPGASERFVGGSERFPGGSEKFPGASERFIGGSEHFPGGSEVFLGGSEVIRFLDGSEEIYNFLPYLFSYLRKYA